MKLPNLTIAAFAAATLGLPASAALAQDMRHDGDRHTTTSTTVTTTDRHDNDHRDWDHRDRHRYDRHDNGHHYGWRNHHRHRVCMTHWRHHERVRVCRWVYR